MEISQACNNGVFLYPFICFVFKTLSTSLFSFTTQHKATEMYWFSCSYLKYLCRQHRHSCTCCQWLPGLYCAITASQNNCMLTPWPQRKTKVPTGNAISSFWGQKTPLATGVTARADRSACHICSQSLLHLPALLCFSQSWVKRKQCSCSIEALQVTQELFITSGNASRKVLASYLPSSQLSPPYCLANTNMPREEKQRNHSRREASLG